MIEVLNKVIYIDPYIIKGEKKADYIFITHNHPDHFSIEDIKKIAVKDTLIICPKECESKLAGYNIKVVAPGDKFEVGQLKCEAVAAYNLHKKFHPKEDKKVGYVIEIGKARIYHAGDTDFIPEMRELKNITVAFVPVDGFYAMGPEEAAQAVKAIKPLIAVPIHYGFKNGHEKNGEEFKSIVNGTVKVEIMKMEEK
jgi:L-ascorbate metabolism protein UlaG (beta-lactamase superfamily)